MPHAPLAFQIAQLRQDKIIYAIEAVATNTLCLLLFFFAESHLHDEMQEIVLRGSVLVALIYTIYMAVGNARRLIKIRALEQRLE